MFTVKVKNKSREQVIRKLTAVLKKDGRFTATLESSAKKVDEIHVRRVRLTEAKPYCGQHPGECAVGPRRRGKWLEWNDWVEFNGLVNDALDQLKADADVWSTPAETLDKGKKMWVRRGTRRRVEYDWEQRPGLFGNGVRVWNHGTENQFAMEE